MKTRVLLAPTGPRGSFIAAIDGKLRVIDPGKTCMTYENGCVCKKCSERAARMHRKFHCLDAVSVRHCECDRPMSDASSNLCVKCGHRRHPQAA